MKGSRVSSIHKSALIVAVLAVGAVGAVTWRAAHWARPRQYELKAAVVTQLDVQARRGEIEFVHPKSGRTMTVAAEHIPENCEILVNGRPATLADVRVGDAVAVRGLINPLDGSVQPEWVHVTRPADTAAPASGPAPVTAPP